MPTTTSKTTVYLEGPAYLRLKQLARSVGRPAAELLREAVAEYLARHPVDRGRWFGLKEAVTLMGDPSEDD
jgi:predicted transcriptional regulator